MAESLVPGARVCDVADKHGLIARHLSQWRGLARKGKLVLPGDRVPMFVPLVVEPVTAPNPVAAKPDAGMVRIEIAGAVLHVASDSSPERAAALAAALKRVL